MLGTSFRDQHLYNDVAWLQMNHMERSMKKLASVFFAVCLSCSAGITASVAQPMPAPLTGQLTANSGSVQTVQYYDYRYDRRRWDRPRYRPHNRYDRRYYRPGPVYRYRPAPIYRGRANAHVRWCYNRYRSYRAYDNTYQPNYGPRRQCYSPYI